MIKIIDGYAFTHDRYGYTLFETGVREKQDFKSRQKTGEMVEYTDTLGYYLTLNSMLSALLRFATKRTTDDAGVKQICDYIAIMEQISKDIRIAAEITEF